MRRLRSAALVACGLLVVSATAVHAQESLLPTTSWGAAPMFAMWHFGTPIAQSAGGVRGVQQFAVPLRARALVGGRWTLDASGAFATSSASVATADGTRTLSLSGLTDLKLRVTGTIIGDRVLVTAGINIPTGATGLNADQTAVLQAIGAPALHMPVSAMGLGTGGTFGLVVAKEAGPWALAAGGSAEVRSEYTPIELALADGNSLTKVAPGTALHLTVGADRAMGDNRLSLVFVADRYTQDRVTSTQSAGGTGDSRYTLGPQGTGIAQLALALGGWREANANLAVRHRGAFTDASGAKIDGSSGSYVEASFGGVRGGPTGRGIIFGADVRYHSGFSFSDALVAAATSAAGVTLGVELPYTSTVLRLAMHAQYGHFDTGTAVSNGVGISLVGAIAARREVR